MGVSVFPAASTSTSTPGDSNRAPKFTYNNSYDLSSVSGMNVIVGTTTAMTYRRTDGCIYFTCGTTNNIWKFDTTNNTGSYVSNTVSWSGVKDIVAAYDGTLYASYSNAANASVETPQYSTDGGANWTYLPNATAGAYRGFMGLVDSGEIPGTSGNLVHLHSASSSAPDGGSWWEGTTKAASNTSANNANDSTNTYNGGRAVFPLRDGDDVKTGTNGIWVGAYNTSAFGVERNGVSYMIRPAHYSVRGQTTGTKQLSFTISPVITSYASTVYTEPVFNINKPTTIDSRWIVGADCISSSNALHVIDFKTLTKASVVPLPYFSGTTAYANTMYAANPVYVSATKKLYVLQGNGNGSVNTTKMHVYDVTTY